MFNGTYNLDDYVDQLLQHDTAPAPQTLGLPAPVDDDEDQLTESKEASNG